MLSSHFDKTKWTSVEFGNVVQNKNESSKNPALEGLTRVVGLDDMDSESLPLRRWSEIGDLPDGTTFTRKFTSGQVLFGKRRSYQEKVSVPDFDGVCSGDILVFEAKDKKMLNKFLPIVVQSADFISHAIATSAGSLSPRTKWSDLAKYQFCLPSLKDQEKIIEIVSAIDQMIDAYQDLPLEAQRGSLLHELLSTGGNNWTETTIVEVLERSVGGVWGSEPGMDQEEVVVVRSTEFTKSGYLNYHTGVNRSIKTSQLSSREIKEGDILLEKSGGGPKQPVGRVVFVESDIPSRFVCSNFIQLLTPSIDVVIPRFIFLVLWTWHSKNKTLEYQAQTTGIRNLRTPDYLKKKVLLPPLVEQKRIVEIVSAMDHVIQSTEQAIRDLKVLRRTLLAEILSVNDNG